MCVFHASFIPKEQLIERGTEIGRKDMELIIKDEEIAQLNGQVQQLQKDIKA